MLSILDWLLIALYFVISLVIGLRYAKFAGKDLSHFFLGGRSLPWYLAGLSMVATTFAADTPLAVTELVANNGVSGNWLWWNMLASGMLTTFFFANLWRRSGVLTEVELIELRYSGPEAKFLRGFKAVYLGLFLNAMIIGWVNVAMISILEGFFGISPQLALAITAGLMLITAAYSSISGLMGVAVTDAFQFIIAMLGCIVLAILVVSSEKIGGITGLTQKLPDWSLQFFPSLSNTGAAGQSLAIGMGTFLAFVGVQWWASWYPGAEPGGGGYVAQRFMSTKDEKNAVFATLFFQFAHYCLRPWPWILVGLAAIVLYPDLTNKKMGYIYAMRDYLPSGWRGLMLVAFIAAYMSTIATQLNWGASYLVNDLYKRFLSPPAKHPDTATAERHYVLVSKFVTLLLMLVGLIASTFINSISGVWQFIMECGAGLGLVLILRWYYWRINAWSEIVATITPFLIFAITKASGITYPTSFFMTVGFTTFAWIVATYLTPPTDANTLISFYQKVQPQGVWWPVRDLLNLPVKNDNNLQIAWLFLCWLSGIAMVYSALFATGKLIFMQWTSGFVWTVASIISLFILRWAMRKSGW
ncbi:MAG: Na+:solute symporter [Sphingobacteriales bacterium]|jgi:SSS family solute:Na+ symporter|nr:Na+:solute symporter [Sphingobacteriales bacterium]MBP9140203.1 Na+:solute symporter [Chitinophagales bacterium]MDA0197663.1 Na+:solute symporter [Bacteroidota bacterium]MBK7528520.1 Na+:solute symporter [Sphingobacteriales bacterium]MBL0246615.1 Na+:solute symporter [Sphingobacteriales bacterium]